MKQKQVAKAFELIGAANTVSILSLGEMEALVLRALAGEFDSLIEGESKPVEVPPVDRSQRVLANGDPVPDDYSHTELKENGQQRDYIVLTPAERAKGFVRPVRRTYVHVGKLPEGEHYEYPVRKLFLGGCGTRTTMATPIAETFARDPKFYDGGGFCCACGRHVPNDELVWEGTTEQVGS